MKKTSIFGCGFIGGKYAEAYPKEVNIIPRDEIASLDNNILYLISTIHNYLPKEGKIFEDIETNLIHFMKVLGRNANEKAIFNLVSTWFVYGTGKIPAKEDYCCSPKGFYSITARAREQLLISYCETYGIKYRIIRLGNVIGVGDKKISLKKNALQHFIKELAQGRDIEIYDKSSIRDFIDVRDVVSAIHLIMKKGETNQIYNVANGQGLYVKDLIKLAWEASGYVSKIKEIPVSDFHKLVQTSSMYLDISKIKKLGYIQRHDIRQSVRELTHYYKNEEG